MYGLHDAANPISAAVPARPVSPRLASTSGIISEKDAAAGSSMNAASIVVCEILLLNVGAPETNIPRWTSKSSACKSIRAVLKRPCMGLVVF
ncbi:hypothetical protein CORC01_03071 [Colletotrichum orchidophilum]|uniref:Uncharacterized protein n=1 Tax=Colletotrichum orchidophilum TaxID=1209926 RepID=A0A1G4BJG9_9PEZI|nr:uncharacterized protein CORC01_03071 [Colletotrichum orchidophilum]OHF01581.1 hypothetical protein CORC01_03071 [Colletotrichum orchidophilum]